MKRNIILIIGLYLIPLVGVAYTPPGTWDPSGSNTESLHAEDYTCNQLKGMVGESYQVMYRLKGCEKNKVKKPVKQYEEQKTYTYPYQQQNHNSYQKQQEYKKKKWAHDMSNWVIDVWLGKYTGGQKLSGYLDPKMMNDIYHNGYMFRGKLNECLSGVIYNDFRNISNMVNTKQYDRMLHWMAGPLRNCHRKVRGY